MKIKIGNIIADEGEFFPFKEALAKLSQVEFKKEHNYELLNTILKNEKNEIEIITIHSDVGKSAAAAATGFLIAKDCDYIINSGLSGAISKVGIDDIVASDSFIMSDFDVKAITRFPGSVSSCELPFFADEKLKSAFLRAYPAAKVGRLSTADSFICDKVIKNKIKEMGATACDMESAAIACVCAKAEIPFFSFRRISDNADDIAYDTYHEMNESNSKKLFEITIDYLKEILNSDEFFNL
jgi:5'-methylthioadenosine/S-adenosylhomocysteine nucleosidase